MRRRVEVAIDGLTVDAASGLDARAVAAAVERALDERLAAEGGKGLRSASLGRVEAGPATDAASVGAAVARAVLGGGVR